MVGNSGGSDRREWLKGIGLGALGLTLGSGLRAGRGVRASGAEVSGGGAPGEKGLYRKAAPARVGLVKGNDRREITYQALKQIEDEVLSSIGNKKVLIKPNFVSTNRQLSATHADAIRGILDFLKGHVKGPIIIGESTASRAGTFDGYKNYGYLPLEKEYNVKLIDLNKQPYVYRFVIGQGNKPIRIRMISTFYNPEMYIISAAKLKTHDRVVTTLSLKNVLLGAPLNDYKKNDKWLTHTASRFSKEAVLHYNMFQLAQEIWPDLGVIDGFVGMEGNGPVGGDPVDTRMVLASRDCVALDVLATTLMGFDPGQIMYLSALAEAGKGQGDLKKIEVRGTPAAQCQHKFKLSKHLVNVYDFS